MPSWCGLVTVDVGLNELVVENEGADEVQEVHYYHLNKAQSQVKAVQPCPSDSFEFSSDIRAFRRWYGHACVRDRESEREQNFETHYRSV